VNQVSLHPLGIRRDGDEWIVGRVATGDFVSVPFEGLRAIELLREGLPVDAVERRLYAETKVAFDVRGFVAALRENGLVAAIDGEAVRSREPERPSLPRLRPEHVRWTLHPLLHIAIGLLALAALTLALLRPGIVPGWEALLWSENGTLVLLVEAVTGLTLVTLHELGHLCTARAAGVPGRIRFGTRLQFLVLQTDVSAVWLLERRIRYTVYLAGMAVDVTICAICLLLVAAYGPATILSVILLTEIGALSTQLLVFMRTDVYFLVQDLARCRNMYGDAAAYLGHLAATVLRRRRRPNPLDAMNPTERRNLRLYAVLLLAGTAACVSVAFAITVPFTLTLLSRAADSLVHARDPVSALDGAGTLLIVGGGQLLWLRVWWRRHGVRVRRVLRLRSDVA